MVQTHTPVHCRLHYASFLSNTHTHTHTHTHTLVIPVIIAPPAGSTFTVNETEDITIECSAIGIPAPAIFFSTVINIILNNTVDSRISLSNTTEPMEYVRDDGEIVQQVYRSMTLSDSEDGDSDEYLCVAASPAVGTTQLRVSFVVQSMLCILKY